MAAVLIGAWALIGDDETTAPSGGVAAVDRACARIDAVDPAVRAFLPEAGRRGRMLAELAAAPGREAAAELPGVPVAVKDIVRVAGLPTRAGSRLPPELFAGPEAAVVRRLRAAGGIVAGKTVTAEFASSAPGPTRNPHDPAHTPGGSSSGSAAAVAAGAVPLSIGSQTVGSVIRPAAYCGVVGFKPTKDRMPIAGIVANAPTFDTLGTFTIDAAGAALAAAALCDDWSIHPSAGLPTLAVPVGRYLDHADAAALTSFAQTLQCLQRKGFRVLEVECFSRGEDEFDRVAARHVTIARYEFTRVHGRWFAAYGDRYRPETAASVRIGQGISRSEYDAARAAAGGFPDRISAAMDAAGIDAWISPAATGPAPRGLGSTGDPIMNLPWTQGLGPVVTVPTGTVGRLPVAIQLAGRIGSDEELLVSAMQIEAAVAHGPQVS